MNKTINKKMPWYLNTLFIAILAAGWMFIIPAIVAIVLLFMQMKYIRTANALLSEYGSLDSITQKTHAMEEQYSDKEDDLKARISDLIKKRDSLKKEISNLEGEIIVKHYDFSDYDGISSEECKNRLAVLRQDSKDLIKDNKAISVFGDGSKRETSNNTKQILRCFNAECDNVLVNLSVKNIDNSRKKVTSAFETLNKIFEVDGVRLNKKMLEYKLEELNLVYTYELKREEEREIQRAIKEQMVEEEKVRREIEQQKKKLEKDQAQCSSEISRLMKYLQGTSSEVEKQMYVDKIKELEARISELEAEKATVLEREANATAGYVYIISNIGSFGDDVYKIGMTRRLEPMDRVKELSSASVPFEFDVHAMIFSNDAPKLEAALHNHFKKCSVNKVNYRKEFFKVSLDEIEGYVKKEFNETTEFTKIPVAKEYRETLRIESELK